MRHVWGKDYKCPFCDGRIQPVTIKTKKRSRILIAHSGEACKDFLDSAAGFIFSLL